MNGYELTERGKIVIALVLVLLLLLVPSAILALKAMAIQSSQETENIDTESSRESQPTLVEPSAPEIADESPPEGGGFNPPDIFPPDNSSLSGEPESVKPHVSVQDSGGFTVGTLTFMYSPGLQDTFDAEILSALIDFLRSPGITPDCLIAIETPLLSGEDAERFISVVISAFAANGVREHQLDFIALPLADSDGMFQVTMYYMKNNGK